MFTQKEDPHEPKLPSVQQAIGTRWFIDYVKAHDVADALWEDFRNREGHSSLQPRFIDDDKRGMTSKGLIVTFDVSVNYYGYAKDGNTEVAPHQSVRRFVEILYRGNTSVHYRERKFSVDLPCNDWEQLANHDSCWRDTSAVEMVVEQAINRILPLIPSEHFYEGCVSVSISPASIGARFLQPVDVRFDFNKENSHILEIVSTTPLVKVKSNA